MYLDYPFFGSRRMAVMLEVNRKHIQRLMRILGIQARYPKPNLSRPAPGHEIYPYLLRGVSIERPHGRLRAAAAGNQNRNGANGSSALMRRPLACREINSRCMVGRCTVLAHAVRIHRRVRHA